jgi:hypothetical protein
MTYLHQHVMEPPATPATLAIPACVPSSADDPLAGKFLVSCG